ncbi:TPA: hypothetical protein ACIBKF_005260 [Salmonella enterica subsp. enterica serovar 6,7:y:-]
MNDAMFYFLVDNVGAGDKPHKINTHYFKLIKNALDTSSDILVLKAMAFIGYYFSYAQVSHRSLQGLLSKCNVKSVQHIHDELPDAVRVKIQLKQVCEHDVYSVLNIRHKQLIDALRKFYSHCTAGSEQEAAKLALYAGLYIITQHGKNTLYILNSNTLINVRNRIIYEELCKGVSVTELMIKYDLSQTHIYAIIRKGRLTV